jgi:hypothetical protein
MVAPFAPPGVQTPGVVVRKLTGKPEEAVALTVTGDWGKVLFASGAKLIVCVALVTAKLRYTGGAGRYLALPTWSAATLQVPAARNVSVAPLAPPELQTRGVLVAKLTANPEDAVAMTMTGDCRGVLLASGPKLIVWGALDAARAVGVLTPMVPSRPATRPQRSTPARQGRFTR